MKLGRKWCAMKEMALRNWPWKCVDLWEIPPSLSYLLKIMPEAVVRGRDWSLFFFHGVWGSYPGGFFQQPFLWLGKKSDCAREAKDAGRTGPIRKQLMWREKSNVWWFTRVKLFSTPRVPQFSIILPLWIMPWTAPWNPPALRHDRGFCSGMQQKSGGGEDPFPFFLKSVRKGCQMSFAIILFSRGSFSYLMDIYSPGHSCL